MRRWLVLLSLLLASWQALGGMRMTEPCCDEHCEHDIACMAASCSACADRALDAGTLVRAPIRVVRALAPPTLLHWSSAPAGDIWKPPRKDACFT